MARDADALIGNSIQGAPFDFTQGKLGRALPSVLPSRSAVNSPSVLEKRRFFQSAGRHVAGPTMETVSIGHR
jgi:hypothetical protein